MMRYPPAVCGSVVIVVALGFAGAPATAQDTPAGDAAARVTSRQAKPPGRTAPRWEIEAHLGGSSFSSPTAGLAQLPGPGIGFPVGRGFPDSREVSSWYFGDGAVLFNTARRAVASNAPITPLDPVLTRAGVESDRGVVLGFRVARAFNDRFGAEFSFDASRTPVRMTDAMRAGISAASASFEHAFRSFSFVSTADSNATILQEGGRRLSATGALNVNLLTGRRLTPFATIGGGTVSTQGVLPNAELVGQYRILDYLDETGATIVDDTDTVHVRYEEHSSPVLLLGGGFRFDLSPRFGIRSDVRFSIGSNTGRIVVDAKASHAGVPAWALTLIGQGASMVFGSPGTERQPSLTGPAISGFETFTSRGRRVQTAITFGYFARF